MTIRAGQAVNYNRLSSEEYNLHSFGTYAVVCLFLSPFCLGTLYLLWNDREERRSKDDAYNNRIRNERDLERVVKAVRRAERQYRRKLRRAEEENDPELRANRDMARRQLRANRKL